MLPSKYFSKSKELWSDQNKKNLIIPITLKNMINNIYFICFALWLPILLECIILARSFHKNTYFWFGFIVLFHYVTFYFTYNLFYGFNFDLFWSMLIGDFMILFILLVKILILKYVFWVSWYRSGISFILSLLVTFAFVYINFYLDEQARIEGILGYNILQKSPESLLISNLL